MNNEAVWWFIAIVLAILLIHRIYRMWKFHRWEKGEIKEQLKREKQK